VASDELFDNASMVQPERALVALRLMEYVRTPGAVAFDESLNTSGRPKVVGLMFDPTFRPLTLQLLAVALLFGWAGARRFGPRETAEPVGRRYMTEHAGAFGQLCFKARVGAGLVASYLEYFRREMGLVHRKDDGNALALLAQRARTDVKAVTRAVRLAESAAAAPRASNAQVAAAVAGLAQIRQKVEHPH
jgi:hypothetical protein